MLRAQIYHLIGTNGRETAKGRAYDWFIMIVAVLSVIPLAFRPERIGGNLESFLFVIETGSVYVLFLDYTLRWLTHDYKTGRYHPLAFVLYPITPLAIMDLLSLLPSLGLLPESFRILRLLRLVKLCAYSKSFSHIVAVFRKESKTLWAVFCIAVSYIFISALVMFVHEPASNFPDFFDALYWATTALTTVGYGDVYPQTDVGKLISMISSLFGVAVIAMPAGIVTAGFVDAIHDEQRQEEARHKGEGTGEGRESGKNVAEAWEGAGADTWLEATGKTDGMKNPGAWKGDGGRL